MSISTSDQRNIVQGLTEFTGSLSSGTLNGVVVLESGYDPKAKEAWVVAGISDKTIAAAHAAADMMAAPPTSSPVPEKATTGQPQPTDMPAQVKRNGSDF